jgi:dienelactone hydrolase
MELPAMVAMPDGPGRKPALLMTSDQAIATVAAPGGDFDSAAKAGRVVLAITPLPWPPSPDKPRPTMGTMLPWTSRAFLVGKTRVGMRTEDLMAAVRWLAAQKDVEASRIDAYRMVKTDMGSVRIGGHVNRLTIDLR